MQLHTQQRQALPAFYQKHQQNKSASSLPVIPGISDAGPYPSSNSIRQPQGPPQPQVPQPKPNVGLGRPTGPPNGAGSSRKLQEEVCLECMMRDRDLADVDVQGEDVWDRESDAGFKELVKREEGLLKSMGNLDSAETSAVHGKFRSVIDMDDTSSSDEFSQNAGSDGPETRRHREEERRRKQAVKARHKEADWRVSKEVGWRGFSWEEGQDGEGLPAGFRGGKGGSLTEEGIKSIMAKFPSASAHRYQKLQDFLRNQWLLVLEIRAEAQRLGHFAFPDDLSSDSSLSSHDAKFPTGTMSSTSYGYRHPLLPGQTGGLRQSPSSPANLLASPVVSTAPSRSNPPRPMTHYLPQREPAREILTPIGYNSSSVGKRGHSKNTSSPGALEPLAINTNVNNTGDDDLWTPDQPQGLRPFSFAVRAGAAAAREGSEGHGSVGGGPGQRKSLWGRWGGSVTSFFGGSQGGSGSMVDMHVGLDNERRNRATSQVYPRAISLASPTRPSFFSRDSRGSSVLDHETRMSRVISQSRLSQVHTGGEGDMEDDGKAGKKKGIKGFFKKMKSKGARKNSKAEPPNLSNYREPSSTQEYSPRSSAPETPLALPPPISVLVRGGDRGHTRTGSGSSSSMLTDGQESVSNRLSGSHLYGSRSVSAPLGNTSTSDVSMGQSASPGSSKFATTTSAVKRESYASGGNRRSVTIGEMGEDRPSVVEVLFNANGANGDRLMCEEPVPVRPGATRPHNKTSTSLSASSQTMLETPPPINYSNANAFFNHQQHIRSSSIDTGGSLSPNRYKNLPPLPPPGSNDNLHIIQPKGSTASPDSFSAVFPDQELSQNKASFYSYPQPQPVAQPSYRQYPQRFHQQPHFQPTGSYAPGYGYGGRASLDQRGSRPRVDKQRAVQTMYGHPMMGIGGTAEVGEVEKKKKGLKGFFGVNKAGRMA
ncbi:hypothetical protein AYX14_04128 [Cryptococcus neoformans]|nr:hypothetical protein AYX14_04128 [Cryptococcus neoformans var. grubii]